MGLTTFLIGATVWPCSPNYIFNVITANFGRTDLKICSSDPPTPIYAGSHLTTFLIGATVWPCSPNYIFNVITANLFLMLSRQILVKFWSDESEDMFIGSADPDLWGVTSHNFFDWSYRLAVLTKLYF